ncbi:uncharacterized protein TrAtP1_012492 [Trichoderma atroviride]|uniref:Uncharacterized protein n=1 Tax=Hypocrea atroviridis (strain ATCC 20476 / IMI 206040) TaxID=452589 RepID=G9NPD3_HYPAI|nr:uncharacterized protein TRIATDRAFT_216269 [Trichoderma atroviride IMI 206040]EHK47404.1 hypothetical protein TRIATDRAFT_216269 [Trichoderma atroviride IMI 206040]UKZ71538.1 hypothetical protein TrAtP1_012492 [Trichoderma atroviride]
MPLTHNLRAIRAPVFPLVAGQQNFSQPSAMPAGIIMLGPKVPGTRCPTCAQQGKEVWVIPGRCCGYCGTPCDSEHHHE